MHSLLHALHGTVMNIESQIRFYPGQEPFCRGTFHQAPPPLTFPHVPLELETSGISGPKAAQLQRFNLSPSFSGHSHPQHPTLPPSSPPLTAASICSSCDPRLA